MDSAVIKFELRLLLLVSYTIQLMPSKAASPPSVHIPPPQTGSVPTHFMLFSSIARAAISLEGMGAFQGSQYIQEGFCENPEKADKISSKTEWMIIFKAVVLISQAVNEV